MGFMQPATGLGEKLMARRYRYAFAKKREASKGKWSVGLAVASLVLKTQRLQMLPQALRLGGAGGKLDKLQPVIYRQRRR